MSKISVEKKVFGKDFSRVVDIEFHQLLNNNNELKPQITIEEFFQEFEDLFYQIPKEGDSDSHRYILRRVAEYLGAKLADETDVNALLDEITSLRQELLDIEKTITNK